MIYAVCNHKGGVGKTTSTINIAAALVQKGKKVLLVDFDPQANLTQSLAVKNPEITIYENMKGEKMICPVEYKHNLYVLPSSLDLSSAEMDLQSEPGREYILKDILSQLVDKFDYIFIDCPPALGLLTINALAASDYVLIPMQAEYLPLRGVAKLTEIIKKIQKRLNSNLKFGGVFLTQYDPRKNLNRDIGESVSELFKDIYLESKISNNVALAEAPTEGKDIFLYNKNSKGALDYLNLCEELIKKKVF